MFKSFLHRQVARMERSYDYDASYVHEVLDASSGAFFKFALFQAISGHNQSVPADAWFAARLAATLCEDCGPCAQLVVNMALKKGVAPGVIAALLRGDLEASGKDAEFGFRYGIAVAQNTTDAVRLSGEAEARYGKRGQTSLAFAVASTRVYPALKRGLGHGAACTKLTVAEETIVLKKAA